MFVAAKQRLTGLLRQRTLWIISPPLLQSVQGNDHRTWRPTLAVHANIADPMLLEIGGGSGRTAAGPEAATLA